jgi:hypothetical protein
MNIHTVVIEAELKTQSFMEQAGQAQRVRLAQRQKNRLRGIAPERFLIACRAGWAAYCSSIRATRQNPA